MTEQEMFFQLLNRAIPVKAAWDKHIQAKASRTMSKKEVEEMLNKECPGLLEEFEASFAFIKKGVQPKPRAIKTEPEPLASPKVKDDIATYMSQRFGRKQPVKTFDEIGGKRTAMTDIDAPFTTTE